MNGWGWKVHSMITGFWMFWLSVASLIVLSYLAPDEQTPERMALVWKSPLDPLRGKSWRFLGNYRVLAAILFVTMIGLYWSFRGTESYYPVKAHLTCSPCRTASLEKPVVAAELTFEGEDGKFAFKQVTDAKGCFEYGSAKLAGGAPEGRLPG